VGNLYRLSTQAVPARSGSSLSYLVDLIMVLVQKDMKVRYKSSWLGYAWSVANPLLFTSVYYVALGVFLRFEIHGYPYPLFLIAGQFPWQWLASSIGGGPMAFINNASLIKKVRFPRNIIIVSNVLSDAVHFLLTIPVTLLAVLWYGREPSWSWIPGIPLLVLAQFLTVYGAALAVASVNVFVRDLERLVALFMQVLFFLTPVIYSVSVVPVQYHIWIKLNPLAPLIRAWQKLLLDNYLDPLLVGAAYLSAFACLVIGTIVYRALSPRFAELV
jgi:lipopolysaccharide transport system permease protein